MLLAAFIVLAAPHWFLAKWGFANMVSTRADQTDIADIAVRLAPDDPQTHYAAAVLYDKTFLPDDQQHSLAEYEKAVALAPHNYLLWLEYGKALTRSGDPQRAERALRQAQVLAPNYALVQWTLGNTLLSEGKPDEGFAEIRRAISGNPVYASSAAAIAYEYFDADAAHVREVAGNSPAANAALALLLAKAGRFDEAANVWLTSERPASDESIKTSAQSLVNLLIGAKKFLLAERVSLSIDSNAAYSPGQIFDGGFEQGIKLENAAPFEWQLTAGSQPQVLQSTGQRHGGLRSLVLIYSSTNGSGLRQISQTVVVKPGGKYELKGYFLSNLKSASPLVWQVADAGDGAVLGTASMKDFSSEWQQFLVNFVVPAGTDGITIRLTREGCGSPVCPISGNIWFDDLSLTGH